MRRSLGFLLGACLLLASACRGFPSGTAEPSSRCVVNSGHTGAVLGLAFDGKRGLLFSSGDDGTVRLWDPSRGIPVRKLQVTQLGARQIAVNPAEPQFAVVVGDGTGSFFLSVWDWERERQLYRLPLKEDPPFMRFSAQGSYLVFAESSWQSLKILNARDGSVVAFHPEGFGIVGFAEMSRSEKTLMTYQVSGSISYWDMTSGQQTLDLPTASFLSHVSISADRRLLAGSTGREVVLVDAVTGAVKLRAGMPGVVSLDISAAGDQVTAVGADGRAQRWAAEGDAFAARPAAARLLPPSLLLSYGTDALYFAEKTGGLGAAGSGAAPSHFADNLLAAVSGLDAARGMLAVGAQKWVRVFSSDLLTGSPTPSFLRTSLAANPFTSRIGLQFLPVDRLLAWRADSTAPGLAVMDVSRLGGQGGQGAVLKSLPTGFRAPLGDLHVSGDSALGLETGGVVRMTDIATGASRFEVHLPGASTVLAWSPADLVAGRNAAAASGSLVRVNARTGETVPLKDRNLFTYGLLLDPAGRGPSGSVTGPVLYSVGIDRAGATNLLSHDGPGFERETLLDGISEEYLEASLALDPETHILYAAMGRDRVVSWDGSLLRTLAVQNCAPRMLVARDGLLFSLDKDSTISVLESSSGTRLAEISLFANGEWCALFHDGRYAASPGGDVNVKVFADGKLAEANEDYRLPIGE
jgi:WD40 repeat protein